MITFDSRFDAVKYLREIGNKDYYCYILSSNGQPFYVGIAKSNKRLLQHEKDAQPYARSTNPLKVRKIRSELRKGNKIQYTIVRFFKSVFEVNHAERSLILFYGKKIDRTGILTNLTDGGEGKPGLAATANQKEAARKANTGKFRSEETRKKLSEANKGKPGTFKGKKHTEETKRKMSENHSGIGHPQYGMRGEMSHNFGRKHSEETRLKIKESLATVDMSYSEERKKNLAEYWKNQPIIECPHCGKTSSFKAAMVRYHFENCKHKHLT